MGPGPASPGHRWLKAGWILSLGALPMGLAGEGLPALPAPGPEPSAPSLGELLPLRPQGLQDDPGRKAPVRIRGRNVEEGPSGWTLVDGGVESQDLLLLADRIQYSQVTGQLEAEGHIRLEGPGLRMRCGRLRMDWNRRIGEAWALELELPPTWVLKSDRVEFNSLQHWEFEKVELSPCPQEKPGWKAYVSKLTVDLDHYARLRNLWIWVFNVPTYYYLPWAIYPAKAERTSGLLPISLAFSSATGTSLAVPYYQTLGDTADLTITPEYFSKEGVLWGGDLRWNPEPTHKGEASGAVINQRTDHVRRYRFSLKELWQREDGWQLTTDINRASDTLLETDYGSGIARLGSNSFDSAAYLGRNFSWGSFNVSAAQQKTYFQPNDPFYQDSFPTSMQKENLPSVQGTFYPVPVGPYYLDGAARFSQLAYKLDLGGTAVTDPDQEQLRDQYRWQRSDGFIRLAGRLGQWGPFRTDLQTSARFTRYSATLATSFFDPEGASGTNLLPTTQQQAAAPFIVDRPAANRLLGSARAQFSAPPIGREFPNFHAFGYRGEVKHTLDPYFALTATSRSSAEGRLPHFDQVDSQPGVAGSAAGEQSLELGVKQHFFGRPGPGVPYADLVRWKISTKYHAHTILLPDGRFQKGWGSLDSDLDVEPNDRLHISLRQSTNVSDNSSDSAVSAQYQSGEGTRLNLAFFSTGINRLLVRQRGIQLGGMQRLWSDQLRLEFSCNYDFTRRGFATSQVALAYVQPCVAESLRYSHVAINYAGSLAKEDRLDFVVTLRGLGDLFKYGF
jgi:hypothetical protein